MPDFAAWVGRAHDFTRSLADVPGADVESATVASPLAEGDAAALERALGRPLPAALREFLVAGSGGVDCRYIYEPEDDKALDALEAVFPDQDAVYGGARLCAAAELPDYARACAEWAAGTWVGEDEAQAALWRGALPFAALNNGDYLALDVRSPADDPPVLYLSHDDDSVAIAGSFTEFLGAWEQLCYVGPEIWLLAEFLDERGRLGAGGAKAERLRQLLGSAA